MIHEIRENGREVAQAYPQVKALIPIRQAGEWVYVSGHGPEDINTYEPLYRGRVGEALTLAQGRQAAAECGKTLLRAIQERYATLDCIAEQVRALFNEPTIFNTLPVSVLPKYIGGYALRALILVNCGDGFQDIGAVADGFSDLCVEVLQERGRHVRTVMGTRNMPNHNIPVEVELIFRLAEGYGEEA